MSSEYVYLQKKQFRAITYDFDTLSSYSFATKLYCLTDFQAAWLLSNTQYMAWLSRWENCPCSPQELADMKAELDFALMTCIDFQPYQIEYTYNQAVAEELQTFADDYTGVPSSVNPNTPDDFFSGDGSTDRVDALCTACKVYMYSYAQNWTTKAQIALGVTVALSFLVSISIVGGVIAGTVLAGLAFLTQTALNAFLDEDALDEVVCCMFDAMTGTVINQANFETSLDSCGFTPGSNQAIIRDIIASDLLTFDNYLSFLNVLGVQFILSQAGVVDCPCSSPWVSNLDFTLSDYGFVFDDFSGDIAGEFQIGVGLVGLPIDTGVELRRQVSGEILFDNTTVESLEFDGDITKGSVDIQASASSVLRYELDQVTVPGSQTVEPFSTYPGGVPTAVNLQSSGYILEGNGIFLRMTASSGAQNGSCVITSAVLTGSGIKPTQLP